MVCWLFVGSWTFSSVFSYLGGEQIISEFVTGLDISPVMFLVMAQIIIFLLGWPQISISLRVYDRTTHR